MSLMMRSMWRCKSVLNYLHEHMGWKPSTQDSKLKRRRECTQVALNYMCAKSCNDIDLKANAHLLRDFERRLDEDPRPKAVRVH
jgi:hypothetical protein